MNSNALFDHLESYVRSKDDVELILLKGHLVLEQALNQMLLVHFKNCQDIAELNLTFSKKLDLLQALRGNDHLSGEFNLIREVNRIRNRLAHQID
ncbi:hypothetical protein GC163_24630 [bacterium]|nr:hypothetical protein [bacterium]